MPLNYGGRFHQHHRVETTWPHPIKPDPQQSVDTKEPRTAGTLAMQDCQLVAERDHFELQFHAAAKPSCEPEKERGDICEHAGDSTARQIKSPAFSTLSVFSVGTAGKINRVTKKQEIQQPNKNSAQDGKASMSSFAFEMPRIYKLKSIRHVAAGLTAANAQTSLKWLVFSIASTGSDCSRTAAQKLLPLLVNRTRGSEDS